MTRRFLLVSLLAFSASSFAADYPVLTPATPESVGFDRARLDKLDSWIQDQIKQGYPSLNLLIVKTTILFIKKRLARRKSTTVPR